MADDCKFKQIRENNSGKHDHLTNDHLTNDKKKKW